MVPTYKSSILFASLAVCVHVGCSTPQLYTPTKHYPFMPNGISHLYQLPLLGESISNLMVVIYSFIFKVHSHIANSGDTDQTPHFMAADLGLHCLPMSHKKDARLIWVKY